MISIIFICHRIRLVNFSGSRPRNHRLSPTADLIARSHSKCESKLHFDGLQLEVNLDHLKSIINRFDVIQRRSQKACGYLSQLENAVNTARGESSGVRSGHGQTNSFVPDEWSSVNAQTCPLCYFLPINMKVYSEAYKVDTAPVMFPPALLLVFKLKRPDKVGGQHQGKRCNCCNKIVRWHSGVASSIARDS